MKRPPDHATDNAAIPPLRLSGLVLICILAVGSAWVLKPEDSELVSRLIADGELDQAQAINGSDSSSALIESMISRHAHSADPAPLEDLSRLAAATDDPGRVLAHLQDVAGEFTPSDLVQSLDPLADRCLQLGRPDLACQAFDLMAAQSPLTDGQLSMAVKASRFCGDPDRAYAFISRNCRRRAISPLDLPAELRSLALRVLRETNRNGEAFELLGEAYRVAGSIGEKRKNLDGLIEAATLAGRTAEIVPFLEDFILQTEAGALPWREFIQRKDRRDLDDDFVRYGKLLAEHLEWQSLTEEAFNLYRRLAFLGDAASLDRCAVIYQWARQERELAELLRVLGPARLKPEYQLLQARLAAGFGEVGAAEKLLRLVLDGDYPEKAGVWEELGRLLESENRPGEAHAAYLKAINLDPMLRDAQSKAAHLSIVNGHYEEALRLYRHLPADLYNDETISAYLQLAKSVGSYADLIQASRTRMDLADSPEPNDFADLAYYHTLEGDLGQAEKILKEGIGMFPDDPGLSEDLIYSLIRSQRLGEAFDVASAAFKVAADPRFVSVLIDTGIATDRTAEAIDVLALDDPLAPSWPALVRLRLAGLYERIGDLHLAAEIYESAHQGGSGPPSVEARESR